MPSLIAERKASGLRYGDASKIARIHRVSVQHVIEVARGRRPGRPPLHKTIALYRQRYAAALQAQQPAA